MFDDAMQPVDTDRAVMTKEEARRLIFDAIPPKDQMALAAWLLSSRLTEIHRSAGLNEVGGYENACQCLQELRDYAQWLDALACEATHRLRCAKHGMIETATQSTH